jgi:hypothetical protein
MTKNAHGKENFPFLYFFVPTTTVSFLVVTMETDLIFLIDLILGEKNRRKQKAMPFFPCIYSDQGEPHLFFSSPKKDTFLSLFTGL